MPATLAFDVYGTLIDTHGVVSALQAIIGDRAGEFSRLWRDKQLEYSFRRGLMKRYENFSVCTRDALDYTSAYLNAELTNDQKKELLSRYRTLPAFDDVIGSLEQLRSAGFHLYAFSNGSKVAVEELLVSADISNYFIDVVSVDSIKSFKPDPAVYHHFLDVSGASAEISWLVSGNPFDVIGAISAGLNSAWVKRSEKAVFDPWGIEPTLTISSLADLGDSISKFSRDSL